MEHSTTIGGSSAERLINCPRSHAIAKSVPPRPAGPYADVGSLQHAAMEQVMEGADPLSLVGFESHGHTLDAEQAGELQIALDLYQDNMDGAIVDREQEVRVAFESPELEGAFGTVDVVGFDPGEGEVHVLDWKFGKGVPVAATDDDGKPNKQLLFYAAALANGFKKNDPRRGADFVLTIIQPAFGLSRITVPYKTVVAFTSTLARAMKALKNPSAPVKAGSWCRWCPAKPACPLIERHSNAALQETPATLSPERVGDWMDKTELLEQWIKDVRALAHEQLEAGQEVPGWKLVAKRATRRWVDDKAALRVLFDLHRKVRIKDITAPKLLGVPAIEKVLKKIDMEIPEGLVEKTSSGTTLAPEGDERPAVFTGVAALKALGQRLQASQ